jgi:xylulokinase
VLPFSTASFFGLNRNNFNAAHMARSVMEGTVFNLGYGFSRMRRLGLRPSEIRATGGGAKSRLWLQIVADVFRTPVVTLKEQEAAAYGAALQSIWSFHSEKGQNIRIEEIVKERVKKDKLAAEPRPKNFAAYEAFQERFNSLWKTLEKEFQLHKEALQGK